MNRRLKRILSIVFAPILLGIILNLGFKAVEFSTGKKYVEYLKENSETIPLNEHFSYAIAAEDLENSKLILVGEAHGVKEPNKFDVDFFKHLHSKYGVRSYFAEMDCAQAFMMNEFMKSGDQHLLSDILKNWVVAQGRNNKDYFEKYIAFHEFYSRLPENEKFYFLGIDKIRDWRFFTSLVNQLSKKDSTLAPLEFDKTKILGQLKERVDVLDSLYSEDSEILLLVNQMKKNIGFHEEKTPREKAMFLNFKSYFSHYELENSKSYGFFGLYHVFQYSIDGELPLAGMIRESDLGLDGKMISINFMFVDSHMVMKSNALPGFLQDEGPYTKMGITSDNLIVIYIYGVMDFKRMTAENHKSFIKMNGQNNPYSDTKRLNTTIQLLPVTDIFKMTDKGKEYIQYTVFVRNSDWAEPMSE